ncbi:MAG: hypothetical protein AAGN35_16105 [Bacteroidota bacterium]
MKTSVTIPKALPEESTLNYVYLREEGIKHIQRLAGEIWTDHNAHDPGITILEQLCYAITDLGYRIDHAIPDLLGVDGASTYRDLYGPARLLTVNPVTLLDLRKVVIDIPGVKNAWVETVRESPGEGGSENETPTPLKLKGLYRVVFEKEESADVTSGLRARVRARLHAGRGIGEDFAEIKQLDAQFIRLHGTVEMGKVEDIHQFVADVLLRAASHISPSVPFYTLQERLDAGMQVDEIFDGPALAHGFIDEADLRRTGRKQDLQTSDLIREIMDEKEVRAVNEMALSTGSETRKRWVLSLDREKTPKLDVEGTLDSLQFARQGLRARLDKAQVLKLYRQKRDRARYPELPPEQRDIVLPETPDRQLESYYSIQNQFPTNYGVGALGLSPSAPAPRQAQAKQLKGYLMFFEQLLANYFSQIAHFRDLLGFGGEDRRTYFNQSLLDSVPGLEAVLKSRESYADYLEAANRDTEVGLERKNRILNHLLARFSEAFTDYGMVLHDPDHTEGQWGARKLITGKANFLREYPELSGGRARAFDYTQPATESHNISGLEKRIARKLGIEDYTHRVLASGEQEGFHLVEHILLRPRGARPASKAEEVPLHLTDLLFSEAIAEFAAGGSAGYTRCSAVGHGLLAGESIEIVGTEGYAGTYPVTAVTEDAFEIEVDFAGNESQGRWKRTSGAGDLYSLQLSFALPNWPARYQNENFKRFVENTIREETPAHLTVYLHWLDRAEMQRFEQVYSDFIAQLRAQ